MIWVLAALMQTVASPPIQPKLEPLSFLTGHCWRGTFPNSTHTDTHCFSVIAGGFVRDLHVVEGAPKPYSGESLYRWDAAGSQIRFDYYNSSGGHSFGIARPMAYGLQFPEENHTEADGTKRTFRAVWRRDKTDILIVNEELRDGQWRELWQMRMVRVARRTAG